VICLLLASVSAAGLLPQAVHAQAVAAAHAFDIHAATLADALVEFGRQAGLQVSVSAEDVRGLSAPAVTGTMTATEALSRLLAGSGFTYSVEGRIVTLVRAPAPAAGAIALDPLRVQDATPDAALRETGTERDARGHDAVYDLDQSSVFAGREEVERYKGVNAADVLKGMVNVFSGDARNGGALDPSIRGVQGPGRVPVIIDGTEQALVVWRGYNGAGNRSYIDPSLIAGVQVLKGPGSTRGVHGSTGGAVVVNTLDASDILKPGQPIGVELKLEGGNNSTDPRLPTLLTGKDYRTVPDFVCPGNFPRRPTPIATNRCASRYATTMTITCCRWATAPSVLPSQGARAMSTCSAPMLIASAAITFRARPNRAITSSATASWRPPPMSANWVSITNPATKSPIPRPNPNLGCSRQAGTSRPMPRCRSASATASRGSARSCHRVSSTPGTAISATHNGR
jgi:hypothetical protein